MPDELVDRILNATCVCLVSSCLILVGISYHEYLTRLESAATIEEFAAPGGTTCKVKNQIFDMDLSTITVVLICNVEGG